MRVGVIKEASRPPAERGRGPRGGRCRTGRGREAFGKIAALSRRELEVFRALGRGASNRAIAARLAIAERTVKAHVGRILAKLRLESSAPGRPRLLCLADVTGRWAPVGAAAGPELAVDLLTDGGDALRDPEQA
ncbi:LuxR C-terminal-related transcriptional regulator [Streptomyces sp. URMC 126]|uniref:LuxR C-terminal-related transcriptional regulator n=1 Tax=Streptomyces sp. URMC 126 TaxID=3423401 RepID=UPI003F1D2867